MAIIGFIGSDRVFFKSHHGTEETEARRGTDPSHSVLEPWIRDKYKYGFHAGVPLDSPDGYAIGTLSVIDRRPGGSRSSTCAGCARSPASSPTEQAMRLAARRALVQADIMKTEVDHRIMNSLQFVSSLLQLQSRNSASTETREQLLAAAHRVRAVARTHRVFSADETRAIACRSCPISASSAASWPAFSMPRSGVVGAAETSVPKDQVLAIGLIVNELAANARKHGAGRITVSFGLAGGEHEPRRDRRGPWPAGRIPGGWTGSRAGARHEWWCAPLAAQLKGRLSTRPPPLARATCVAVSFPAM